VCHSVKSIVLFTEEQRMKKFIKQWRFTLILIVSVAAGALIGHFFKAQALHLKPLGDLFLNLLFTAVVPLIFFSLSSAVAGSSNLKRLGRIASGPHRGIDAGGICRDWHHLGVSDDWCGQSL
jgi:hypothetical protein